MNPKGYVWINRTFEHTKFWPNPQITLDGVIDLEKVYKEALAGKLVQVMDISDHDGSMLVIGESPEAGHFFMDDRKRRYQRISPNY